MQRHRSRLWHEEGKVDQWMHVLPIDSEHTRLFVRDVPQHIVVDLVRGHAPHGDGDPRVLLEGQPAAVAVEIEDMLRVERDHLGKFEEDDGVVDVDVEDLLRELLVMLERDPCVREVFLRRLRYVEVWLDLLQFIYHPVDSLE